jgi:tetratricopeptide (TPR) repeat protein
MNDSNVEQPVPNSNDPTGPDGAVDPNAETRRISPADPGETISSASLAETRRVESAPDASMLAETVRMSVPPLGQAASEFPESSLAETAAVSVPGGETPPAPPPAAPGIIPPAKKPRRGWLRAALVGALILLGVGAISGFLGYQSGIGARTSAAATLTSRQAEEQVKLAGDDMTNKRYDLAVQRYEYVMKINPNYPGLIDRLTAAKLAMNATATPTVVPTPTVTPTPDRRNVEQLFQQGNEALRNSKWDDAIDALLKLRKTDPKYNAVQVDGLLFMALRNRGKAKILKADLEGGIYDLKQAEQFGPLDAEAQSLDTWAGLYLTGASFWEIDWKQAVYYFSQVGPAMPGLMDGSKMTAAQRYREALIKYADQLAEKDECQALEMYTTALSMGGADPKLQEAIDALDKRCNGGGEDNGTPGQPAETPKPKAKRTPTPKP